MEAYWVILDQSHSQAKPTSQGCCDKIENDARVGQVRSKDYTIFPCTKERRRCCSWKGLSSSIFPLRNTEVVLLSALKPAVPSLWGAVSQGKWREIFSSDTEISQTKGKLKALLQPTAMAHKLFCCDLFSRSAGKVSRKAPHWQAMRSHPHHPIPLYMFLHTDFNRDM